MTRSRPRRSAAPLWAGRLFLWGGRGLYLGPAFDTDLHTHHAVQVCIGLDSTFRLRSALTRPWRRYEAAIVASDQPHQLDGGGAVLALLYLDPDAAEVQPLGRELSPADFRPLSPSQLRGLLPPLRASRSAALSSAQAGLLCDEIVRVLAPPGGTLPLPDLRVARALELLRSAPDRRASLAQVAAAVALSPGRLVHLFRAHTGLPMRRYLLWLRLADALQQLARGISLTEAAHAAGFADSAHLSRTFRRMLGLSPSRLLSSQFVRGQP